MFVTNTQTKSVTVLLPCKTHVITVRRMVARIWSSSSWVPDIFVIMKSNTSTKSLRFGRVSRFVDVFDVFDVFYIDGSRLVIDGFSEMSFSIGICSWWFIVLHLLLIVVGGDWLFHLLGEGGAEGQAFLSGDVHEDVEGGWFPMLAELVRIWRDSRDLS